MVLISDTPSSIKTRFGFTDHHQSDSISSEIQIRSSFHTNTDREDDGVVVDSGSASQSFEFSEDPSFWKDHNVQVIIRIRPLSSSEISLQGYSKCIRQESCQTITWTGHPESRFTFDLVADENVSQEKLFKVAGVPMVENCVGGYNSCMFAYGQTGSGKTHTMLGDIEGGTRRHSVNCGMTPRVFEYLFQRIQKEREARRDEKLMFTCKCSFLEIYNEQILDLLDPSSNNLQLREDNKKGVHVENLKEVEVTSAREVILQLIQGAANRKVAATNMNRASSRSHSVFTCVIESKWESQGVTHHRFARLNLVDLAGSERQKSSGAEGERLKEATNINKSLSTLGLVIMNLVSISNGKSLHVPYRDSKLTFLLQDSLGGNSKTIIIANISPSNCCSLETLSTLKFAQRAKFIKNNAIVNEDTTGDVIAMRQQIQQLKKEVARLRASVNGGADNLDNDVLSVTFPGSPGSFKWEGLHGSLTPLTSSKRTTSQKKDYEVALVGAFKREKEKELALQSLVLENQAALQLAKQREDEIQGLKMMLRFREAGIKRLEGVASRKISAETHLLKEKEEHLKEIEVLRSQVERNQEATRFAMENLRLKEEIRRLKSFCEEGERETMVEQIAALQNKLLEALDWKLMHESDVSTVQRADAITAPDIQNNDNLLLSIKEQESPGHSSIKGENEFLRLQVIQNQAEIEALRKKLEFCQEEKEKLERHISDLDRGLEEERSLRVMEEKFKQLQLASSATGAPIPFDDQMELKTMVDAIAAASQREAEAHEKAITLSKENDQLRMKLKVLIEDNNKLIELYEQANAEMRNSALIAIDSQAERAVPQLSDEKEGEMRKAIEDLEHQLMDMHEENEKLMSLYEKAMQERDEIKRMLCASEQNHDESKGEYDCPEKLVEVDEGEWLESGDTPDSGENNGEAASEIPETFKRPEQIQDNNTDHLHVHMDKNEAGRSDDQNGNIAVNVCPQPDESSCRSEKKMSLEETAQLMKLFMFNESVILNEESGFVQSIGHESRLEDHPVNLHSSLERKPLNTVAEQNPPELKLVKENLVNAQQQLESSVRIVATFSSVEKALAEDEELSRQYEELDGEVKLKQQELELLKHLSSEVQERRALTNKKISALKYSLSELSSSLMYFEQREDRARARVCASSAYLEQKNKELAHLEACRSEHDISLAKCQHFEEEERSKLSSLKLKLDEEKQKIENETVLFAIDNIEKVDPSKRNLIVGGKATDLLKSEEEKTKLQAEINACRERLGLILKEYGELKEKRKKIEMQIQALHVEITKGRQTLEEMESALYGVTQEKEIVVEMTVNGKNEADSLILAYQQHVFEEDMKQGEINILKEELEQDLRNMEELKLARITSSHRKLQYLDEMKKNSCLSSKMEEELQIAMGFVEKAKLLLVEDSSK